ncbi:hypothetical protein LCGC14_0702430 [marine sediment metagenome]|uniref:Uncharacterized protein n=1 Tax=marine sediment metagenome TaxID=412755 RepID=A0A0F9QHF6_9ZZZZ
MTDNGRISKWIGECRHEPKHDPHDGWHCDKCEMGFESKPTNIKYYSDPAAWTPALYKAIEDAGLKVSFTIGLLIQLGITTEAAEKLRVLEDAEKRHECSKLGLALFDIFDILQAATPAQQSAALSRALQEQEDA